MRLLLPILLLCLLPSCKTPGKIETKSVSLTPPGNASLPSSIKEGTKLRTEEIPAGTTVVKERVEATADAPATTRETITYTEPAKNTVEEKTVDATVSNERAPDQQVAMHKVDVQERRPLLYAAMASIVAAGILLYAKQKDLGVLAGSIAAALFALWYAPWLSILAIGLVSAGAGWWVYAQHREKKRTEETLRRTVQSVQELSVDSPAMAKELLEYQSSNLDASHKELIKQIAPSTDKSYIVERASSATSS